ncbi:MAG: ABC transporter substrate-binding protein [Burkholderiaceae bacterium]
MQTFKPTRILPTAPSCAALSRRQLLSLAAGSGLLASPWVRAQDSGPLRLGQSAALSGPLGELGQAMHQGAKACFEALNARGGVQGRSIELVSSDDGYDVKRAGANMRAFLDDRSIFGLFNCMGTPMIEAVLPMVLEEGIPFFAPFSGALLTRPKGARNVFNIRASYPDEAEQLVQHLTTVGIRRIAVVYQNNAFGKEFTAAQEALRRRQLAAVSAVTVESNASRFVELTMVTRDGRFIK